MFLKNAFRRGERFSFNLLRDSPMFPLWLSQPLGCRKTILLLAIGFHYWFRREMRFCRAFGAPELTCEHIIRFRFHGSRHFLLCRRIPKNFREPSGSRARGLCFPLT